MPENEIPRRCDLLRNTPAELAIRAAMRAVEAVGAHPLLTDSVVLLEEAFNKLADYVDEDYVAAGILTPGHAPDCTCAACVREWLRANYEKDATPA